jgi:hypothetical protein
MKKKRILLGLLAVVVVAGWVLPAGVFAQDINKIKQRMLNRLPKIVKLKEKGIVGENNSGYLEFVGEKKDGKEIVESENDDRRKIYKFIAEKQNTSIDVVEKHRAAQIEMKADKGDWLQDANGNWYQK